MNEHGKTIAGLFAAMLGAGLIYVGVATDVATDIANQLVTGIGGVVALGGIVGVYLRRRVANREGENK